jgi:hypothetical protein
VAAKKKVTSKAKPKRPAPKPERKTSPASKRAGPKAKHAASQKTAKVRAGVAKPRVKAESAPSIPALAPVPQPQPHLQPPPNIVRPGLQKRADTAPIGVVTVMDGNREIEQSTFYSPSGRDEYVQRWEARGYECRFTRWNN